MDTTNSNYNDFNELEEMREQMNAIKNKVDQEGHLNEERVKQAIQGKMRGLHHSLLLFCIVMGLFVPFILWDFIKEHMSWPFIIFTILIFAGSFTAEYFINRMKINDMGEDMVKTAQKLMQMKKNRKTQLTVGFCSLAIWIPWYMYEIYRTSLPEIGEANMSSFMIIIIIAMLIGIALGLTIGLSVYRKLQRTNDEMINQISELTSEQ